MNLQKYNYSLLGRLFPFSCISCLSWFLCFLLAPIVTFAADSTPVRSLISGSNVLVIAHRGNSSVAPENTLPAFQSALDVKADLIELDYYHAADGVPVVIHDEISRSWW
jgi:hypothetical protein